MVRKILSIAKNTFIETTRQPIYAIIIGSFIFLSFMSPSLSMYTMDEDVKLLRELGLSTLFLAGLFIAIFSATGGLTEEIESKTVTTVISKPIRRSTFILGKFFGIVGAVALSHYICSIAYIVMVRHGVMSAAWQERDWVVIVVAAVAIILILLITTFLNYSYDWNFCSTGVRIAAIIATISIIILAFIDKEWKFNPAQNGFSMFDINASLLLFFAILILASVAILFATRLNLVLTLSMVIGVFLLGLVSDYAFGRFADRHIWAKIGKILVPNFQLFWVADAIHEEAAVQLPYLGISLGYAVLYCLGILLLAIALFQRRQVG